MTRASLSRISARLALLFVAQCGGRAAPPSWPPAPSLACRADEGPRPPVAEEPLPEARASVENAVDEPTGDYSRAREAASHDPDHAIVLLRRVAGGETGDTPYHRERAALDLAGLLFERGLYAESFAGLARIAHDPGHVKHAAAGFWLARFLEVDAHALRAVEELGRWYVPGYEAMRTDGTGVGPDARDPRSALRFVHGRYAFLRGRYAEARRAFAAVSPGSRFHAFARGCAALSAAFDQAPRRDR
jgi:hypothetical protein